MSLITRIILEAETVSAREAMGTAWRASMAQAALRREPAGRRSDPRANNSPTGAGAPTGNNSPGTFGRNAAPLVAEVKARKNGSGFALLEKWLDTYDVLFLRRDRADPLVLLPRSTWMALLEKARR